MGLLAAESAPGSGVLTAWSLILTRVYQHTRGSLLLSILMHVSLSASAFVTGLTYSSIGDELTWTVIQAGLAWLVAGGFWLATRPAPEGQVPQVPASVSSCQHVRAAQGWMHPSICAGQSRLSVSWISPSTTPASPTTLFQGELVTPG